MTDRTGKRLLLLGPVPERSAVGGLPAALASVAEELRRLGWDVDAPMFDAPAPTIVGAPKMLGALQRSALFLRARLAIPADLRRTLSAALWPAGVRRGMAENLRWAEDQLARPERYDVVLVCPDVNVPGILALALDRHPRVAAVSLFALAEELRARLWGLPRSQGAHPYYFRPAEARQIRCALFASERWQRDALAAGLAPGVAHTVYFGIPVGPMPPRSEPAGRRLLWIGRLSPEKGLHFLLRALPRLRQQLPGLTLTAVAGEGEAAYRHQIEQIIRSEQLADSVHLHAPVARSELPRLYASHDALFFYSIFDEPVALVLMESFAHGLPVVANHAGTADLVRDGETCRTCDPGAPESIAAAFGRLFGDPAATRAMTMRARALVESKYSSAAMGEAYDRLLSALCAGG